ncbi:MAG: hypothetical protein ABIJ91_02355 [Candidatus Kuenenbacteria bacterium]
MKKIIIILIVLIFLIGIGYFVFINSQKSDKISLEEPSDASFKKIEKMEETENLPVMNKEQQKLFESIERDGERLGEVRVIKVGLALYKQKHISYPPGDSLKLGEINTACLNDAGWQTSNCVNSYLDPIYGDPLPDKSYLYTQLDGGKSYIIKFELENDSYELKAGLHSIGPDSYDVK